MASQSPSSLLHEAKDKMQVKSNMVANSLSFICYIFNGFYYKTHNLFEYYMKNATFSG
jgi:hypothetical protein